MSGGHSYFPLDDLLPPPAEDMINDIREKSDVDAEMPCSNPRGFPTTKTGFQKFKRNLSWRMIW